MDTVNSEGHVTVRMGRPPYHYFITTTKENVKLHTEGTGGEEQQQQAASGDQSALQDEPTPEEDGASSRQGDEDDVSGSLDDNENNDEENAHEGQDNTSVEAPSASQHQEHQGRKESIVIRFQMYGISMISQ